MTLFLRDEDGKTIVDTEYWIKSDHSTQSQYLEISSGLHIKNYSTFLVKNLYRSETLADDFHDLSELRGWLWESYFMGGNNNDPEKYDEVLDELKKIFTKAAKKYDLQFIWD